MNHSVTFLKHPSSIIAFVVISVQSFCNIDSYLYAQIGQFDSACFFMCGKALMNGMVPYTEFTDSKGILLWFIYGIGYLIDHYSYVGVFWMACIAVWATINIAYKTARLYLEEKPALLSALLLLIPLMYWNFYTETKAEHFCWPAVSWGIYVLMRSLKGLVVLNKHYLWLGVGVVCCLMLKWSVAIMMLSLVASVGWIALQQKSLLSCIQGVALGMIVAFLPFAVYFTIVDNWQDWIQEYFVNTMASVSMPLQDTISAYSNEWLEMITTRRFIYLLYTLPVLLWWKRTDWFATALPALCGLFFIALSIRHDEFGHYISVAGSFAILTIIIVVKFWQQWHLRLRYLSALGALAMIYIVWGTIHYTDCFCTKAGEKFNQYMAVSAAMAEIDNPLVINIGQEKGLCMGNTLPGTRYWITQLGRTEEMWRSQKAGIESKKADYVIYYGTDPNIDIWLESLGYHLWFDCNGIIYTKHDLTEVRNIHSLSFRDVITKRTYAEVHGLK